MDTSARIIRVLSRAQVDAVDAEIERCLGIAGRELEVDIISFCQESEGRVSAALQWRAVGYMDPPLEIDLGEATWWRDQLEEDLVLDDLSELPSEAIYERELLIERGTRSMATSALGDGRRGFVAAETMRSQRRWREPELDLLAVLAGAAAAALDRRDHQLSLLRAAEEAARASEHKNLVIAALSHELQSPLTSIKMLASMLKNGHYGDLTHEQKGAMRELLNASELVFAVIGDLLDLSRIEAGRMTLDPQRADVTRTIERVLYATAPRAREREITVTVEKPEEEVVADVDDRKLSQIVQNLVVNGIKYNDIGGRLTVRLTADAEEFRIEVEDTGIGISERDQERIFGTFDRVEGARTGRGEVLSEGTGLGLALVRALTDLQGGRLELDSRPGRGSTFAVILPRSPLERSVGREPYLGGLFRTEG